jgi:putative flippase GtrA
VLFIELFTNAGVPTWLSNILAQLICYPLSFFLQKTIVFRKKSV